MRYSVLPILLLFCTSLASAADRVDYMRDVLPILETYCVGCHTEDDAEGGLHMQSHAALLRGGKSGLALTPGTPSSSRLLLMVSGKMEPLMPPEGEARPQESEIELLTAWVEQGAPGPEGEVPIRRELRTPKILPAADVHVPITAIALSPDASMRAVARFRHVEIRRPDDSLVTAIAEQPGKVNSLTFSKDGSKILIASGLTGAFGQAAVYATASGERITEMVGHRDTLYAAVFSPDESQIATAGYDRDILLWNAKTGEPTGKLTGHNGAIFDLAYSPSGEVLASACADETVKVWNVKTGMRLDTLSQPEGEVYAVDFTADGKFIVAASADNRLRVWRFLSKSKPRINPNVATRFIDETPLVHFALSRDGKFLVVLSESGNVKVIRTSDWSQAGTLEPLPDSGSDVQISPDGRTALISLMNGELVTRQIPALTEEVREVVKTTRPVYMQLDELVKTDEKKLRQARQANPSIAQSMVKTQGNASHRPLLVDRGAEIAGTISAAGEEDLFQWHANKGEVWAIDADAAAGSGLDPIVTVLDTAGEPVLRTRLQAVRDSYFTFRGKDSNQVGDFRIFNWQEMHLSEFLYAAGEVTRLWMHPRGPDSGFNVYPGEGQRWTYFGTTNTTHALGEPAYIVRALPEGETPTANGLPVFNVYYENDDDPMRLAGKNSRLLFTAPTDGRYTVRIADTRGEGSDTSGYTLRIRAAVPGFKPMVAAAKSPLLRGSGREFVVRVDRQDGFDGPVSFDIPDLPPGIKANVPLVIEAGQRFAIGTLWVAENVQPWEGKLSPELIAHAEVAGRRVEHRVGKVGDLELGDRPSVIPSLQPNDRTVAEDEDWTLQVRRGETVSARVVIRRKEGSNGEINFGKEDSGRNTSQGVYVDNIGLNGLLILKDVNDREFFLSADISAVPGKRSFFLTARVDGNVTTHPITVEVLP